jgi:hypothetical protein
MKAIQVTEGVHIPMTRGSIVLIFDPKEIDIAIHACEYLADALEERARIRCGTEELWDFAILMRKYNEKYNKRV